MDCKVVLISLIGLFLGGGQPGKTVRMLATMPELSINDEVIKRHQYVVHIF